MAVIPAFCPTKPTPLPVKACVMNGKSQSFCEEYLGPFTGLIHEGRIAISMNLADKYSLLQ